MLWNSRSSIRVRLVLRVRRNNYQYHGDGARVQLAAVLLHVGYVELDLHALRLLVLTEDSTMWTSARKVTEYFLHAARWKVSLEKGMEAL